MDDAPATANTTTPGPDRADRADTYDALVCTHWGDWRELERQRLPRPPLAPGQVRLRVRHAGVGHAVRLFVAGTYQRRPPLPFTPGTEAAGEVLELAPDVTHLRVGQRVCAALDWGAFAEEAVTTAATVYPLPDGLPLARAAALPITYGTVWSALEWRARLQPGETVLVHGAGGALGLAAVQVARRLGARVIATASTDAKRAAALANGAWQALPADAGALPAAVKALCPDGVDVVFDPVGGALFDAAVRCAAPEGRLLVIGFAGGSIPQVAANLLLVKNLAVIGFNYGLYIGWGLRDERVRHAPAVHRVMDQVLGAVARGEMPPPRTEHFPFTDWLAALDTTLSRRSVGKVVIDF